jgi:hypothetical protein
MRQTPDPQAKKVVLTGSRGDSGRGAKPSKPRVVKAQPPNFPKLVPVRPGAPTPKGATKPSTQAQRSHVHEARRQRAEDIQHAQAAHDIMTSKDLATANAFNAAHPAHPQYAKYVPITAKQRQEAQAGGPLGKLTGLNVKKALDNVPSDALELVTTTPSSVAKLASTAVHDPKKVPGMLVEPYKQLVKDPKNFIEGHPVTAALMVSPAARLPGLSVGKVARLTGKQTLARTAATLPGTALKETRVGSKDFTIRAIQARKDVKAPAPVMTATQIQRQADETYAAGKTHAGRVEASAYKEAKRRTKGMPKVERRVAIQEHVEGARGGARNQGDQRFARQFGATAYHNEQVVVGGPKQASPGVVHALDFKPKVSKNPADAAWGRGILHSDGRVETWSETDKTHAAAGADIYAGTKRFNVGPDGMVAPGSLGHRDIQRILDADPRLKPPKGYVAPHVDAAPTSQVLVKPKDATEGVLHPTREAASAVAEKLNAKEPTVQRGTRLYGKEAVSNEFVVKAVGDKFAVLPKVAADRLARQRTVGTSKATGAKVLRQSRGMFTRTVLPYRPTWLSGQGIEGVVRSAVQGAGPTSYLRARKTVNAMEAIKPGSGHALLERAAPGGLVGRTAGMEMTTKTLKQEFPESTVARALTDVGRSPGIRQVRGLHHAISSFVFEKLNAKTLEGIPQTMMLGKALKNSPLMERSIIGLSDKAIQDAARGLQGTEHQVAAARAVERAYGKYAGFSPKQREIIMHWTPFLPWYLNTAQFLLSVLPKDHPLAAALVADTGVATEDWRKAQGLSTRGGEMLPAFMLGGYPTKGGKNITRLGHYTPFGVGSDVTSAAAGLPLPQFSGFYNALNGIDWKGHELKHSDGTPFNQGEKWLYGLTQLGESFVPLASQAEQVATSKDKTDALKKQVRLISSTPSNRALKTGPPGVPPPPGGGKKAVKLPGPPPPPSP